MADTMEKPECFMDESEETSSSLRNQSSPTQHNLIQTIEQTECFKDETSSSLHNQSLPTQHNLTQTIEQTECFKDETSNSLHNQSSPTQHNLIQTIEQTECFKDETSSSLHNQSSPTQHNLETHYESSETQSFTVEIKLKVEKERKEIVSEAKADTTEKGNEEYHRLTDQSKDKPVDQEDDWNSSDDNYKLVSTLRDKDRVETAPAIRSKMENKRFRSDKYHRSRSRSPSRYRRHESPDRRRRSYSRDRAGRRSRRRNRSPDRSRRSYRRDARSRSRSRNRRADTPERSRRSYSRDRVRRSRSRSRHRRGDTPNRSRRSYSRDRVRRSRSRSRHRRGDTPDRSRRSYSRDRLSRSRSRSRHRRDDTPDRSQRSYSRDRDSRRSRSRSQENTDGMSTNNYLTNRDAEQSRNISNCPKEGHLNRWYSSTENRFEGNDKASSSNVDNSNGSAEIYSINRGTDQQVQEIFSRNSTIGILRSRIQSSLSKVFSNKFNTSSTATSAQSSEGMQSVWLEENGTRTSITHTNRSSESTKSGDVDENIIKSIVSREMSNRMDSNVNIDMTVDRTVDQRVQNIHNSQIRDPRILRMLTSQHVPHGNPSPSQNYNDFCFSTSGSSANLTSNVCALPNTPMFNQPTLESQKNQQLSGKIRRTSGKQSAPMTYGEYKRLQESGTTDEKETIVKSIPIRKVTTDPMQIKREGKATQKAELHEKLEPDSTPRKYGRMQPNNNTPRIALPANFPTRKSGESRVNATKNATKMTTLHDERKANTTTTMPKKVDVRQLQGNVNATVTEDKTSNETAMNTLRELMNSQQLLTLVDLMEQMTENNSLGKVKEALGKHTNETHTGAPKKAAEVFSTSAKYVVESTVPKKRSKNELDRLHEDIDNMFIRDGVLSANGRRRNRDKTIVQPSYEAVIESKKQIIKDPPRTLKRSVSTFNYENAHIPPHTKTRTSRLQTLKVLSSEDADDPDWVRNKRVPILVLKKLPSMTHKQSVTKMQPLPPVSQKPRIKNNNIELHSLKKIVTCQICDNPPGISLMSHYLNNHPQSEVLTSRISPEAAQFLRSSTTKEIETINLGNGPLMYKNFCYFCNIYRTYSKACWMDHITRHTGYFLFKCSNCSRKFASRPMNHSCGDRSYIERLVMPIFKQEHIKAFVCELCNYVRFYEAEMEMHLRNEHDDGERKAFKEYTFLTMPKKKNALPPLKKCDCNGKSTSEIKSESVFQQESTSEVKMEDVFGEECEFQVQTANANANCNEYSGDEEYDFKVLTEKLGKICSDTSLTSFQYNEEPNF